MPAKDYEVELLAPEPEPIHEDPFDETNPRALINLVGSRIREGINAIPPSYFEMEEAPLRRLAYPPSPDDPPGTRTIVPSWARKCRIAFWEEYDKCQRNNEECMDSSAIYAEHCHRGEFYNKLVAHPARLALLLRPSAPYRLLLAELHELGLERMREVLDLPVTSDNGAPNVKLIDMQQRIFEHIDMRKKGAIIQRIDQRTLSLSGTLPPGALPPGGTGALPPPQRTMAELNLELLALEKRSKELSQPGVIDVDLTRSTLPDTIKIGVPHDSEEDD